MTSAASSSPVPALQASRFLEFLRRELAPTPQRWRATLRITLACLAASFPVMAFHLHLGLIDKPDASTGRSLPFVFDSFTLAGAIDFNASNGDRLVIMPDSRQVRFAYPLYGGIQNFP